MTVNERVLQYLTDAEDWVCGLSLADPQVGGLRAAARVHDLRSQDIDIESKTCDCRRCRRRRKNAQAAGRRFAPVACYRLVRQEVAA